MQAAAAWFTVNVWPAIVIVPVRGLVFGLADALNATVPAPLPLAPLVTVNQRGVVAHARPRTPGQGRHAC